MLNNQADGRDKIETTSPTIQHSLNKGEHDELNTGKKGIGCFFKKIETTCTHTHPDVLSRFSLQITTVNGCLQFRKKQLESNKMKLKFYTRKNFIVSKPDFLLIFLVSQSEVVWLFLLFLFFQ